MARPSWSSSVVTGTPVSVCDSVPLAEPSLTVTYGWVPERGLLDVLTRTAYWTGWPRHFGPVSGSDPKISDTIGRYVLLIYCVV